MKKQLVLTLAAAVVMLAAVSCGDAATSPAAETQSAAAVTEAVTEAAETEEVKISDDLPERDYGGEVFHIFTRTNTTNYAFCVDETSGDTLDDALFQRNATVGERFNITFEEDYYETETDPQKLITAGDDTYDLMNVRCTAANNLAVNNACYRISSLDYIDLSKPYWDEELSYAIAVGNNIYTAIGATDLTAIDFTAVLLFNKELISKYGLESPYEYVTNGTWTLDVLGEMAAAATTDLNGDGSMDDSDQYGILGVAKYVQCSMLPGGNAWYITKDENNYPVYTANGDEHFYDVFNKIFSITNEQGTWYKTSDDTNEGTTYAEMFRNGQGLFFGTIFYYIESMRDMTTDFGILPYPKYDEAQESYCTRLSFFDTCVVPISCKNVEMSSIILEALTCESYNTVIPAYKEVALKGKFARDESSSDIIDLMLNSRVVDFGDTYFQSELRDGIIAKRFMSGKNDIISTMEKQEKTVNKLITKMVEAYEAME